MIIHVIQVKKLKTCVQTKIKQQEQNKQYVYLCIIVYCIVYLTRNCLWDMFKLHDCVKYILIFTHFYI